MKCPKCNHKMKTVPVKVAGAKNKAISNQCTNCDFFEFEQDSSKKVLEELKNTPLRMRQKIVKLSADRLGIYFNKHVVESLNIKKGEEVFVSVPDKKHIVLEIV